MPKDETGQGASSLYSEDQGYHWRPAARHFPTIRRSRSGRPRRRILVRGPDLTVDGKVSPKLDSTVEPNLKVVVDTFPPTLLLDPDGRRGSLASVRWEVKDENLDLKSLVLEYQVEGWVCGASADRRGPKLIGGQQWDAGTAEALKVRASVADKAGNVAEAAIDIPEGTASSRDLATNDPGYEVLPKVFRSGWKRIRDHGRPGFHAGEPGRRTRARKRSSGPGDRGDRRARLHRHAVAGRRIGAESDWDREPGFARSRAIESSGCRESTRGSVRGGRRGPHRR